jgi:hypothetical protein
MTFEQFLGLTCTEALKHVGYGHRKYTHVVKRGVNQYAHEIYHLGTNEVVGYMDAHEASDFAVAKFKEIQEKEKNQ